jgi:hypothetical protein
MLFEPFSKISCKMLVVLIKKLVLEDGIITKNDEGTAPLRAGHDDPKRLDSISL